MCRRHCRCWLTTLPPARVRRASSRLGGRHARSRSRRQACRAQLTPGNQKATLELNLGGAGRTWVLRGGYRCPITAVGNGYCTFHNVDDQDLCGQPKKNGTPCGWRVTISTCPHHRTPVREAAAETKRREAAARLHATQVQTVHRRACPTCDSGPDERCVTANGTTRRFHSARITAAGLAADRATVQRLRREGITPAVSVG
ncbi:zinc finger domain-containing protein [Streptodolium elevatio]